MGANIFEETLKLGVNNNASDVHFSSGMPPIIRILGELKRVDTPPINAESLSDFLNNFLSEKQKDAIVSGNEVDLALYLKGIARFRVNIYKHAKGLSAAFRIIPPHIRSLDELRMPEAVSEFIKRKKGLILLTGPTGSGKSTTLSAMIHEINMNRREHIITIEDPIEYVHEPKQSLIHQREVGSDTRSFASALRSALREDPDVILVGEMRDLETITNALFAAETGHLVLSTLHTNSAAETIDRIINVFPPEQQRQIRIVLAHTMIAVISQRLAKMHMKDERIAVMEILAGTPAVKNLIREGKTHQIDSVIQTGSEFGMQNFDKCLNQLRQNNLVSPDLKISDLT